MNLKYITNKLYMENIDDTREVQYKILRSNMTRITVQLHSGAKLEFDDIKDFEYRNGKFLEITTKSENSIVFPFTSIVAFVVDEHAIEEKINTKRDEVESLYEILRRL